MPKLVEIAGESPGRTINVFDMPLMFGNVDGVHHVTAAQDGAEYLVRVFVRNGIPYLVDLSQMGNAQVNGKHLGIYESGVDKPLAHGDTVALGSTIFRIELDANDIARTQVVKPVNRTVMIDPNDLGNQFNPGPATPAAPKKEETYVWDQEEGPPVWPKVLMWGGLGAAVIGLGVYSYFGFAEARKPLVNGGSDLLVYKPGQFWQYKITGGKVETLVIKRNRLDTVVLTITEGEVRTAVVSEKIPGIPEPYLALSSSVRLKLEDGTTRTASKIEYFVQDPTSRDLSIIGFAFSPGKYQWLEDIQPKFPGSWRGAIASSYDLVFNPPESVRKDLNQVEALSPDSVTNVRKIKEAEKSFTWANRKISFHSEGLEIVSTPVAKYRAFKLVFDEVGELYSENRVDFWSPSLGAPAKTSYSATTLLSNVNYEAELVRTNIQAK